MQPSHGFAGCIQTAHESFQRDRVVEAVLDIVLACPHHLDRDPVHFLRDDRRLDREIGFRLAPEAAAEQRHVDLHLLGREAEGLGAEIMRGLRALHARPHFARAVLDDGGSGRWLHRRMGEMGNVVLRLDLLGGASHRGVEISGLANHEPWLAGRRFQVGTIGFQLVDGIRTIVPNDLKRFSALDRGVSVVGYYGDAPKRQEHRGNVGAWNAHELFDAGYGHRRGLVIGFYFAAQNRRARHNSEFHAGKEDILPIDGASGRDVEPVDDLGPLLADIAELRGVLELQRSPLLELPSRRRRRSIRHSRASHRSSCLRPRGSSPRRR